MPKGPKGVRRPADTNSAAVMVGRIAVGEVEDEPSAGPGRAAGGKAGGNGDHTATVHGFPPLYVARAYAHSPERIVEIRPAGR